MPIATVSGEAGSLNRQHGANPAIAYGSKKALKSSSRNATARFAHIVVYDFNLAPAKLAGTRFKTVLPALALKVVDNLLDRRLADIDDGAPGQVFSCDFCHGTPPSL